MRTMTATAGAAITGLIHAAMGRERRDRVQLKPGDTAPDFRDSRIRQSRASSSRLPGCRERGDRAGFPKRSRVDARLNASRCVRAAMC